MLTPKLSKYIALVALLALLITTVISGLYIGSIALAVCAYLLYELLGTDHIHYNVRQDYDYHCQSSHTTELTINNNVTFLPKNNRYWMKTTLIEVNCKATLSGYLFDPFIDIHCGDQIIRQYFERGFQGRRYLNISHLPLTVSEKISFTLKHCRFKTNNCQVISTGNPEFKDKRILVIAPHADDAEIAAFGLYSSHNSMVVTITAGESEPDQQHIAITKSFEAASLLKGTLRAWDSIAVPLWAGLTTEQVINLGYPDSSLEKLYTTPKTSFLTQSQTTFRQFNSLRLFSDSQQSISWQSLVQDLTEILSKFKPDIIVTPHSEMDSHKDHQFATKAIQQAIAKEHANNITWLYYINHLSSTDRWPFGNYGTTMAPPPGQAQIEGFYSHPVDQPTQTRKAYSLDMMHDLRKPVKIKHQFRYWLQQKLIGRVFHPLGKDPYFRKNIRSNELFIIETSRHQ